MLKIDFYIFGGLHSTRKKVRNQHGKIVGITCQGSYGHEESWNVMELENAFFRPEKVMNFKKNWPRS